LGNTFNVVYDNIRHKNLVGELTITPISRVKLALQAEYNIYTMNVLTAAWHKPNYLGRATLSYNIKDKILVNAAFYLEGKRNVQALNGDILEIDGVMDLNLGVEYRLNKRVSAYLNFNNITANRYHLWYLYPAHRFNMRGGVTYAF
jgi:outer membrane receptor protein involved in Fe transport